MIVYMLRTITLLILFKGYSPVWVKHTVGILLYMNMSSQYFTNWFVLAFQASVSFISWPVFGVRSTQTGQKLQQTLSTSVLQESYLLAF